MLNFTWCRLADLSGLEAHELIRTRESVFVVEQRCPYQEADGLDARAWHLIGRVADASAPIAAYLRVVEPGAQYAEPAIGRVLTMPDYRRAGLARTLMREGIVRARSVFGSVGIRISAQVYLQAFYETLGFIAQGTSYLEDDIPHIEMWLAPPTP